MAELPNLQTDWGISPRVVEFTIPGATLSVQLLVQDLVDTLNSNTEQASHSDDSLENLDDDPIIDAEGKAGLGGVLETGITAEMKNGQVGFIHPGVPASTGTATSNTSPSGTTIRLIDLSADFVTDGIRRGDGLINFSDESFTDVLRVVSATELECRLLRGGTDNDFDIGDSYKIWNVIQCAVEQGNVVGTDEFDAELNPFLPTMFTQITYAKSTEAAAVSQETLVAQLATILADFGLDISSPKTITENVARESYDEEVAVGDGAFTKEVRKVGSVTTITRTS